MEDLRFRAEEGGGGGCLGCSGYRVSCMQHDVMPYTYPFAALYGPSWRRLRLQRLWFRVVGFGTQQASKLAIFIDLGP